ncbi:rapamycin-insensitive companion of mTOR [Anopheles ziemanni]|uniref:rapamycin-insensitive companion of mTOR n=1 Tax=Anopheles coustani TaxID=139045 RepID=UPI00265821ED|nr:rapamycin-insensitive companion of mTOR [Anopheles coustani]XP_058175752.1 rapamycin-insensitive companion of mTOR [Anopheles ziemanni]
MAMSSWMIRRSIRQRSRPPPEDCYRLDTGKTLRENAVDIYGGLYAWHTSVNKRLSLLNGLVLLLDRWKRDAGLGSGMSLDLDSSADSASGTSAARRRTASLLALERYSSLGYSIEQWVCCVSRSLVHPLPQIRAGALRALRRLLLAPEDLRALNRLQLAHLVCRSLDVMLRNGEERVQALKLVRRMLVVAPDELSAAIVRCLVALGESGSGGAYGADGTAGGAGGVAGGAGGVGGGKSTMGGAGEDRLLRCCLATLCEIGVLNPMLLIECGGVGVITRSVLECHSPRIAESLCGVLLYLLEWPRTREIAAVRLDCFAAPYCDFTYRVGIMDRNKDARDLRFTCSRLALLSVLRSWAGTVEFCNPHRPSGLKALIEILYLNQLEIRKAVLDLLYELMGLPQPVWTDEYSVAMSVVDPAEYQDSWRLHEGFVAAEGTAILPSLASTVPNLCEIHLALLLYCFVDNGLLNALIEVIVSSDTFISVRATILLAKITHQLHCLLPAEICASTPAAPLPALVARAIQGNHQARAAISAIQQFHLMLRNRPASCSLYLDSIIQSGALINTREFRRELSSTGGDQRGAAGAVPPIFKYGTLDGLKRVRHDSSGSSTGGAGGFLGQASVFDWSWTGSGQGGSGFERELVRSNSSAGGVPGVSSGATGPSQTGGSGSGTLKRSAKRNKLLQLWDNIKEGDRLIHDSNVLAVKDANMWDWQIVITILRSDLLGMKLDEQNSRFVRRIVDYFKPSNNRFSHQDLSHLYSSRQLPAYVTAGLELIDAMLQSSELECMRLLTDLFTDISRQLLAIHAGKSAHECLFSPQHMTGTMCQQYFLFIGRMCRTERGLEILRNTDVFKELSTIVLKTNHLCYVKLIVSGLDYSLEGEPRAIFAKALLRHPSPKARLYATQMLRVLLRARLRNFEVWGIQLMLKLVAALQGVEGQSTRCVQLAALELLEEACYERTYLEELAHFWPRLDRLGDRGKMVMMRFYSIPRGLNHPEAHPVHELERWVDTLNERYVLLVEADTHAHLTQHIRTEDGTYSRRHVASGAPSENATAGAPNLLPHLYGQLAQTTQGFTQLLRYGQLPELAERVRDGRCRNEQDSLRLKAALWALCHACTSKESVEYMGTHYPWLLARLVQLVRTADVYSIRATALHGICLIASTAQGADALQALDWVTSRHDRSIHWPLNEPTDWCSDQDRSSTHDDTTGGELEHSHRRHSCASTGDESTGTATTTTTTSSSLPTSTFAGLATRMRTLSADGSSPPPSPGLARRTIAPPAFQLSPILSSSNLAPGTGERREKHPPAEGPGHRKHRTMSRLRRPLLSRSSEEDLEDALLSLDADRSLFSSFRSQLSGKQTQYGGLPSSMGTSAMMTSSFDERLELSWKLHSLDRKLHRLSMKYHQYSEEGSSDGRSTRYLMPTKPNTSGPCFIGICFPRELMDLFPEPEVRRTHVRSFLAPGTERRSPSARSTSEKPATVDQQTGVSSCSRSTAADEVDEGVMADYEQESKSANASALQVSLSTTGSSSSTGTGLLEEEDEHWWTHSKHIRAQCLHCCRTSHPAEERWTDGDDEVASGADYADDDGYEEREGVKRPPSVRQLADELIANSVLRHVQRMANPVWSKQSRSVLLDIKQSHPGAFQDVCLYSEVCRLLGCNTYRLGSRRFLQELFFDLDFGRTGGASGRDDKDGPSRRQPIGDHSGSDGDRYSVQLHIQTQNLTQATAPTTTTTTTTPTTVIGKKGSAGAGGGAGCPSFLLRSPPLPSVHEASVENLDEMSSTPKKASTGRMVEAPVGDRSWHRRQNSSDDGGARLRTALGSPSAASENRPRSTGATGPASLPPVSGRPRFNTLELDLSCSRNKFPIRDRSKIDYSPTTPPVSEAMSRSASSSSASFVSWGSASVSASTVTSPTQALPPSGPGALPSGGLFCEQRLRLKSSKSEATLMKNK